MNEDTVIITAFLSFFGFIVWMIFTTVRRYKTTKLQADIQNKVLDMFGASQDLLSYVQSDAGKLFLHSLVVEQRTIYGRILSAVQAGVLLSFFGSALLFLRGKVSGAEEGFLVFGTLFARSALALHVRRGSPPSYPSHSGCWRKAKGSSDESCMPDESQTRIEKFEALAHHDFQNAAPTIDMNEDAFGLFYDRTARRSWAYLQRVSAIGTSPMICSRRAIAECYPPIFQLWMRPRASAICFGSQRTFCVTAGVVGRS